MSMINPPDEQPLGKEDVCQAIEDWLKANPDAPEIVRLALDHYTNLIQNLDAKSQKMTRLLGELRRAFGIVPSSEKRKNYGEKTSRRERLIAERDRLKEIIADEKRRNKKRKRKVNNIEDQLKELDQIELSPAEEAEIQEFVEGCDAALDFGGPARCDLACAPHSETLMPSPGVRVEHETVECLLSASDKQNAKRVFFDERLRIDLDLVIRMQRVMVEQAEIDGEDGPTIVSASTEHIGPKGMKVTWEFLSQMTILCGQYAMPLNRLSSLLSTGEYRFSSTTITRYFQYVANRLLPVYLHLGQQLKDCDILCGDDTSALVLEVQDAFSRKAEVPWKDYATRDLAADYCKKTATPCLSAQVGRYFTLGRERKNGKGQKMSLNVSVVSGRTNQDDPRSLIVFFRTHFGSFGDLVTEMIQERMPSKKELVVQSDLATTNNLSIDASKVQLTQAGCLSHARRRFAKSEDEAPDHCGLILGLFHSLSTLEKSLDAVGRQVDNTLALREFAAKKTWDEILEACHNIKVEWSKDTGPGEAARYVINNFGKLTYYLHDPRLTTNNDFSERMLRMEKLIKANALFRKTLDGRATLDIVRTILQTAIAAKANCQEYLDWYLRQPDEEIKKNPAKFTPLAYARQI